MEAKRYLGVSDKHKINFPTLMSLEGWRVMVGRTKIIKIPCLPLFNHIVCITASKFLHNWNNISRRAFNNIYWKPLGDVMWQAPLRYRIWLIKYVWCFCGKWSMMKIVGSWYRDQFQCSKAGHKTTIHLPYYPHPDMEDTFEQGAPNLKVQLEKIYTYHNCFCHNRLRQEKGNKTFAQHFKWFLSQDNTDQDEIVWEHFLESKSTISLTYHQ